MSLTDNIRGALQDIEYAADKHPMDIEGIRANAKYIYQVLALIDKGSKNTVGYISVNEEFYAAQ